MFTFIMLTALFNYLPAKAASLPQLQMVTQPANEYYSGERVSFSVASPNYGGKVEYRVILYNGTTKKTSELWANEPGYYYKKWQPAGNYNFTINWPVMGMEPGAYSLTVLVRRIGSKVAYDSFVKTNTFWVINGPKKIVMIDDLNVDIYAGDKYELPNSVYARMSDGTITSVGVKWDTNYIDTSNPGIQTIYGNVENYNKKAALLLKIKDISEKNLARKSAAVAIGNNWMYFPKGNTFGNDIYKKRIDNQSMIQLSKNISKNQSSIVISGNWIYYNSSGIFYKVDINGNNLVKLNTYPMCWPDQSPCFMVKGDWIYYIDYGYGGRFENTGLYKLKTDGTENISILKDFNENAGFDISGEWIYYVNNKSREKGIYKMNIDGTGQTKILDDDTYINSIIASNDWIIYTNKLGIFKVRIDGTGSTKISDNETVNAYTILVAGDWIYYSAYYGVPTDNKINLYKINISTLEKITIAENLSMENFTIIDDWLYYFNNARSFGYEKLYMLKSDGSQKKEINLK